MKDMYFDEAVNRYVLADDFVKQETGIDLATWLNTFGDANPSDVPRRFLKRVSMIIYNYIERRTFQSRAVINARISVPCNWQVFCEALLNQVLYMVNSGDYGLQSGVNLKDGRAMHLSELRGNVRISPDAIDCLLNGGFLYAGNMDGGAV